MGHWVLGCHDLTWVFAFPLEPDTWETLRNGKSRFLAGEHASNIYIYIYICFFLGESPFGDIWVPVVLQGSIAASRLKHAFDHI